MSNDFDPELLRFYSKTKLRELQKSTELTLKQKYELIKVTSPIDENTHEYKIVGNGFVVRKKQRAGGKTTCESPGGGPGATPASKITQTAPKKDAPKEEPKSTSADPPEEKPIEETPKEEPKAEPKVDPFQDLKKYLN